MPDTHTTDATLTAAQLEALRQQWSTLGMELRELPTDWLPRQVELAKRHGNRKELTRFVTDLYRISTRAIGKGLLADDETKAVIALIGVVAARVALDRAALEAMRRTR